MKRLLPERKKQAFEEELRKAISEKEKAAYEAELLKKKKYIKQKKQSARKDEEIAALQNNSLICRPDSFLIRLPFRSKNALLSLRLELSQAHQKELNEVRIEKDKKIEALQNGIIKGF